MNKKLPVILSLLLLPAAALLSFWLFRDSDHKQLRRTLDELCDIVSKSTNENPAVSGLKANRADKVFAPKCEVRIGRHFFDGTYTATEMGANIMRFKSSFREIKISSSDLETALTPPSENTPPTAKLYFTGRCVGVLKNAPQEKVDEIRDVEAAAVKTEKGWRLTNIVIVKILQK